MQAIRHVPLEDRETFKYALAATLVKHHNHWKAFETVFEVYFSLRGDEYQIGDELVELPEMDDDEQGDQQGSGDRQGGGGENLTPEELAEMLYQSLMRGDQQMMRGVARQPSSGMPAWSRAVRSVAPTTCTARCGTSTLMVCSNGCSSRNRTKTAKPRRTSSSASPVTSTNRANQLQQEIEAEIRRRLVADRGVEAMAKTLRKPLPEASTSCTPLVRRWHRSARRSGRSPANSPLACSASGATAGRAARLPPYRARQSQLWRCARRAEVPEPSAPQARDLRHRRHFRLSRCVCSLHLHLVYAISGQFSKVRAFVFIDGLDEVTHMFEGVEDINEAVHRVNTEADVVWVDGHSDYGHALGVFWEKYGNEIGLVPRS